MTIINVKTLALLLAVAPLTGVYASDASDEEATAHAFGLSVAEYRQQIAQYTSMSSTHESTIASREQEELNYALSASMHGSVAHQPSVISSHVPSAVDQSPSINEADEQIRAYKAFEIAQQERLLNEIYMRDMQASLSIPGMALLQVHALDVYKTVPSPTLEEIGTTFQERIAQMVVQDQEEGQQEDASGSPEGNPDDGSADL